MAKNNFNNVSVPVGKKSKHNEGNHHITTASWGWIQPIYTIDCVPGDKIDYHPTIFIRTPALAVPTFGQIKVSQHSFFVPNRLLWKDWNNFILGGDDGAQIYTKPFCLYQDLVPLVCADTAHRDGVKSKSDALLELFWQDYPGFQLGYEERGLLSTLIYGLGLNPTSCLSRVDPQDPGASTYVNGSDGSNPHYITEKRIDLMPFRAYQQIWWDYYRDSVLVPESAKDTILKTDGGRQFEIGPNDADDVLVPGTECMITRKGTYKKDYFTTARESPQSGSVAVVPVDLADSSVNPGLNPVSGSVGILVGGFSTALKGNVFLNNSGQSQQNASNSVIGKFSVEMLRLADSFQRFKEKINITGSRPISRILGQFGIAPSAVRLDMAEHVGGEDRIMDIVQVTSTAQTSEGDLADNAAYGIVRYSGGRQKYDVKEHGIFMSVLCIEPVVGYCDGIDKMFTRFSKEDHYTPEYENLGFEPIEMSELVAPTIGAAFGTSFPLADDIFGFQPRYSSYKWKRDVLAGDYARINTEEGADSWHTFRRFDPVKISLNSFFNEIHVNQYGNNWNRLFVDTNDDYDPFNIDILNRNDMIRPMTGFMTPALDGIYKQNGHDISIPYGGIRL